MLSKISIPTIPLILLIILLASIIVLTLIVSQNYFNSSEINLLVERAEEKNLEYELVIHNSLTNSYNFRILNQ